MVRIRYGYNKDALLMYSRCGKWFGYDMDTIRVHCGCGGCSRWLGYDTDTISMLCEGVGDVVGA